MDTLAVITLPKDASFADAEKTVVTDLPEDAPQGAVALLSYKYNDRKIGQVYLISASAAEAEANGETASDDGNTASDSAASNTGASGKSKQAKSSFHLTLPKLPKVSVRTVLIVVVSVLLAAACAALVWLFYRRHQEEKRRQEDRRKRRRQRLQEIGCSQEEFENCLKSGWARPIGRLAQRRQMRAQSRRSLTWMCDLVQDRFRRQMQPRPGWQRVEKQELVPRKRSR